MEMIQVRRNSTSSGVDDTLVKDLQVCVNQARKAEGRLKKILSDKAVHAAFVSKPIQDLGAALQAQED